MSDKYQEQVKTIAVDLISSLLFSFGCTNETNCMSYIVASCDGEYDDVVLIR